MYYLVIGLIEIISAVFLSIFHQGVIANISGMLLFVTAIMIPLGNFMAVNRKAGTPGLKVLLALTSAIGMLLELLGLYHKVSIPDVGLKLIFIYIGISSVLIYVDQKRHPGHRSVNQERQDTLR